MMQTNKKIRGLALLTGGVLAASALLQPAPVQAKDNSKAYKTGAIVLGAAAAYLIVKGKTLPGVAAAAGAYLAYKQGRKEDSQNDYPQYPGYPQYPNNRKPSSYPNTYPTYPRNSYPTNSHPTSNYPNTYPTNSYPNTYPSGGYGGYNQYPNDYRNVAPSSAVPVRGNGDYTLR